MRTPGDCEYERTVVCLSGRNAKSCCTLSGRDIWTNCRAVGHCIWEGESIQMELLEEEAEEDECQ